MERPEGLDCLDQAPDDIAHPVGLGHARPGVRWGGLGRTEVRQDATQHLVAILAAAREHERVVVGVGPAGESRPPDAGRAAVDVELLGHRGRERPRGLPRLEHADLGALAEESGELVGIQVRLTCRSGRS